MQEEKKIYVTNFEKQKEKLVLETKRLVSSNSALVSQNDILKTTLESREIAWNRQVELLAEKGNVIILTRDQPTGTRPWPVWSAEKFSKRLLALVRNGNYGIEKTKSSNVRRNKQMRKKFETESRVLSDRFQFASNQVNFHLPF